MDDVVTIEGTAVDVEEPHALTVIRREALAATVTPEDTITLASRMATALSDVVERQKLYAVIQGKKYPQVEAWMTIGRMDNVVAREAGNPERHEDGSYEAVVELIRLSDGMVIGRGSALCGTKGDKPWDTRAEPARRSMAVTRATSRAFRQQYSWIMALAGYEPTPADEMPHADAMPPGDEGNQRPLGTHTTPPPRPELERRTGNDGLIGTVAVSGTQDFNLRQTPDDTFVLGFRLKEGNRAGQIVAAEGALAIELEAMRDTLIGQRATVWGRYSDETYDKKKADGSVDTINFKVLHADRVQTPTGMLPAPEPTPDTPTPAQRAEQAELDALPW